MTTAPYVELHFDPTGFKPEAIPRAGAFLGTPAEALEAALAVTRAEVVRKAQLEIASIGVPTESQFLRIMDLAWQATFWRYRKVSAPIIADAYLSAYRAANAGDVPSSVIYALADQHTEKTGEYFYTSSREALSEGFNTLVNRRVPAKAAADRVTEGFGLTPRQMRAYTAASKFDTPVSSTEPRSLKARARAYVEKAFRGRVRKLAKQEEHNIDEQAKQFAWMWLQDKGRLNQRAQKLWITARDERVCPTCGPLHGVKIGINEQFKTTEGEFWTPGLHPNCRCVVRLIENRFSKNLTGIALADFNDEHPRGYGGRFGVKTRTPTPTETQTDAEINAVFEGLVSTIPHRGHGMTARYGRPTAAYKPPAPVRTELPVNLVTSNPHKTEEAKVRQVQIRTQARVRSQAKAKLRALPDTGAVTTRQGTKTGTAEHTAWVVAIEQGDGRFQLSNAEVLDQRGAYEKADAIVQSEVNEVLQHMGSSTTFQDADGREWVVSGDDLRDLVEAHARYANIPVGGTPKTAKKSFREFPDIEAQALDEDGDVALDENGDPWKEKFGGKWLGQQLDIDEIPFETPKILQVDQEILNAQGDAATAGTFEAERIRDRAKGTDYNIPVYRAKPVDLGEQHKLGD